VICEAWDIAVVPFPFTDGPDTKRRPAAVLSQADFQRSSGHTVMAMITTSRQSMWPGDIPLPAGLAGLHYDCLLRMKLFTLDNSLIVKVIGSLPRQLQAKARKTFRQFLDI
jgi:mRNA interferase MazF